MKNRRIDLRKISKSAPSRSFGNFIYPSWYVIEASGALSLTETAYRIIRKDSFGVVEQVTGKLNYDSVLAKFKALPVS